MPMERKTSNWVLDKIGSVLMLRKIMAERLFGHNRPKNSKEKRLLYAGEDGRQATRGQTCNDLVTGFERMDRAGHGGCITPAWRPTGKDGGKSSESQLSRLYHVNITRSTGSFFSVLLFFYPSLL